MRIAIPGTHRAHKTGVGKTLIGLTSILIALSGSASAWASSTPMEVPLGSQTARAAPAEIPMHGMSANDQSRSTILAFARCTVRSHRKIVESVLAMPPLDKQSQYALGKLADSDCLRAGELEMPNILMRGGLYAALYIADYDSVPAVPIMTPLDFTVDVGGATTPEAQQYLWLHQFADCVVRADTLDSRALVLAEVASPSENAIFAALAPHFSGCLIKGQSLTFSKAVLASVIAEVLYRQTKAASVPRSGS